MADDFSWDEWDRTGPAVATYDPGPKSPLLALSDEYEAATDAFGEACDLDADAENLHLDAMSEAWSAAGDVAQTARRFHCEMQPKVVDAKKRWNRAAAVKERTKAKARELEHRLIAMQSHQKFVAAADGGPR